MAAVIYCFGQMMGYIVVVMVGTEARWLSPLSLV